MDYGNVLPRVKWRPRSIKVYIYTYISFTLKRFESPEADVMSLPRESSRREAKLFQSDRLTILSIERGNFVEFIHVECLSIARLKSRPSFVSRGRIIGNHRSSGKSVSDPNKLRVTMITNLEFGRIVCISLATK